MSYTIFYVFHFIDNILIIQHLIQQVHHQQKQLFDTYDVPPTCFGSLLGHPLGDLLTKECNSGRLCHAPWCKHLPTAQG